MNTNPWDPDEYDGSFAFVTEYGSGLLSLVNAQPGERVLDVGCGTGHLAAAMANAGAVVVGIDTDDSMLAAARQAHPDVKFLWADGQSFTVGQLGESEPFDAALSNAALHWMPRQDEALVCIRSALRSGGRFVAEMGGQHNIAAVERSLRDSLAALDLADIEISANYFPTLAEQATRLERAGFRIELMRWFRRRTPLPPDQTPEHWTRHFRANVWRRVPNDRQAALAEALLTHCAEAGLLDDGKWYIDYCRLRFTAYAG